MRTKLWIVVVLATLAAPAHAAETAAPQGRGPCAADVQRLCADRLDEGRQGVRACLVEQRDALSDACKARIAEARGARATATPPAGTTMD